MVLPTPTLPLSRTVNPGIKVDDPEYVWNVMPVPVPRPLTVNTPDNGPDVPIPTLPD